MQIRLSLTGHKSNINCIDTHPMNPNLFVTCSYDKTIKTWDLEKKDYVENIAYHEDNIWAVKYSLNGKFVVSGSIIISFFSQFFLKGAENGKLVVHEI